MSEAEPAVGEVLRAAREAKGWSIQEVANRLRLMNRQIDAIESNDFAALGQPVFARGFVRNYARLLGLNHEAMLLTMQEETLAAPVEVAQTLSLVMPGSWFTSRWLIGGLLALLALVVVFIGLYAWLSSDAEDVVVSLPPPPQPLHSVAALVPAPPVVEQTSDIPESPVNTAPVSESAVNAAPAPESAVNTASAPMAMTSPEPLPASITAPAPAIARALRFQFDANAWVEVKDGTGSVLQRKMNRKGSILTLLGQPPFTLEVGNASKVRMTYNGRPLDLKPYSVGNVARFSLEQ